MSKSNKDSKPVIVLILIFVLIALVFYLGAVVSREYDFNLPFISESANEEVEETENESVEESSEVEETSEMITEEFEANLQFNAIGSDEPGIMTLKHKIIYPSDWYLEINDINIGGSVNVIDKNLIFEKGDIYLKVSPHSIGYSEDEQRMENSVLVSSYTSPANDANPQKEIYRFQNETTQDWYYFTKMYEVYVNFAIGENLDTEDTQIKSDPIYWFADIYTNATEQDLEVVDDIVSSFEIIEWIQD